MNDALSRQAQKINEYRTRTGHYQKTIAGRRFWVGPGVFPGGTDTGLLCDTIVIQPEERVLDLCTGIGAVALVAAATEGSTVIGTDINPAAIKTAALNRDYHQLTNARFLLADTYPKNESPFDVITINPPYTDNEAPDLVAACFWDKGNQVVKNFFAGLQSHLKPAGRAYMTWPNFADEYLPLKLAREYGYAITKINRRASGSSGFEYYVYLIRP